MGHLAADPSQLTAPKLSALTWCDAGASAEGCRSISCAVSCRRFAPVCKNGGTPGRLPREQVARRAGRAIGAQGTCRACSTVVRCAVPSGTARVQPSGMCMRHVGCSLHDRQHGRPEGGLPGSCLPEYEWWQRDAWTDKPACGGAAAAAATAITGSRHTDTGELPRPEAASSG